MCFGSKPSAPPPPPPPPPPINPIEIAPSENAAADAAKRKRLGASQLQIPLIPAAAAGLGIPKAA
jgi:hypothetical protein